MTRRWIGAGVVAFAVGAALLVGFLRWRGSDAERLDDLTSEVAALPGVEDVSTAHARDLRVSLAPDATVEDAEAVAEAERRGREQPRHEPGCALCQT